MDDLIEHLKALDLSEKEVDAYLASLEQGEGGIVPIARKLTVPRNTAAYIMEKLQEKHLVNILHKGTRRIYAAVPPRTIVTLLRNKRARLDEQIDSLQSSLPQLNQIFNLTPFQPKVRFFRGQEEIRTIYEEMLEAPIDRMWYVGEQDKITDILGERYLKSWLKRRVEKHIKTITIRVRSGEVDDPAFTGAKDYLRSIRFAPDDFESPGHITIYGDNVAIITTSKENFGIVITSREYATIMKSWFNQLWKVSGER